MRARIPHPPTQADDSSAADETFEPDVVCISSEEWLALFEREVQDWLGINAAEFVRRFRAGEYEERDNPVIDLFSVSIPFYETVVRE